MAKSKLSIGDLVLIVKEADEVSQHKSIGKIGEIVRIHENEVMPYEVKLKTKHYLLTDICFYKKELIKLNKLAKLFYT